MKRLLSLLPMVLVFIFSFAGTALAAGAVAPADGSLLDLAKPVLDAVMHGQWFLAAAGALVLTAALAKRQLAPHVPWLRTDWGAALLVVVGSFGGAVFTALVAAGPGAVMSSALAYTAIKVALAAAGGYSLLKPLIKLAQAQAPAWLQPVLAVLAWVFESGIGTSPDVAAAEAAGDVAVKAKPPTGAAGIVGKPRDIP